MRSALLLLALCSAGAVGCVDGDVSLSIVQMEAVTAPTCVASGTEGIQRSRGLLDVMYGVPYVGVPLVRNNLLARTMGVEYNSIQVVGADVDLQVPDSLAAAVADSASQRFLHFYYPASAGRIDPTGLGPMFVNLLDGGLAQKLYDTAKGAQVTVVAKIRPVGKTSSEQIVGGAFYFPIDLCNDCIRPSQGPCPLPKGTPVNPDGCFPTQDDVATCCTNGAGGVTCGTAAVSVN
jgi:hypothetical protein